MLLIDIPVGIVAGQVIADAGREAIRSGNKDVISRVRSIAIIFAYLFTTPVVIYFFMGWPAWETNYFWAWVDHIQGTPSLAIVGFMIVAMSFVPVIIGFETGKLLVRSGKVKLLRVVYSCVFLLILVIVYFSRELTFNIAATYADYENKVFVSFWSNPFFIYWLVLTIFFWGSLIACYFYVNNKFRKVNTSI